MNKMNMNVKFNIIINVVFFANCHSNSKILISNLKECVQRHLAKEPLSTSNFFHIQF